MPEEEAFWSLTQIVEVLLPLDYYPNLLGVLVDLRIFQQLMREQLPQLCSHLDLLQFDCSLLVTKWLICLFVNHLPLDAELAVWDLFMIKGSALLFRVALTLFHLMTPDILATTDYSEVYMIIDGFGHKVTRDQLLSSLLKGITNREITF